MNSEKLDVSVALTGLEFVLVHHEDVVVTGSNHMQKMLPDNPIRGGEAAFEECRSVDVVILGAGEDESIGDQSFRRVAVLASVAVEHCSDRIRIGHKPTHLAT